MTTRSPRCEPPCQISLLATLHRVRPERSGRVVLVIGAASPVMVPATGVGLPAWRVFVMGAPLVFDDETVSDFSAAERCLQAVCRLRLPTARALYMTQAQRDADAAVAALKEWLASRPDDKDTLDAQINSAARESLARRRRPVVLLPFG